jgi:hypothetical protein
MFKVRVTFCQITFNWYETNTGIFMSWCLQQAIPVVWGINLLCPQGMTPLKGYMKKAKFQLAQLGNKDNYRLNQ